MGENGEDGRERRVRKRQGEEGRWRKGQREPEKEKKRKRENCMSKAPRSEQSGALNVIYQFVLS